MKGSIGYAKNVKRYFVAWYHEADKKTYKIYKYKGIYLYDRKIAEKLLAKMQSDTENKVFRIENFTRQECDVIPYLRKWLEAVKTTLSPATCKDYKNSIERHMVPFFEKRFIQLHEIQHDTLMELLGSIKREGKGKWNVMYCLHACLDYAWRSLRIPMVPPFPKKKAYNLTEPIIQWLPEQRQEAVIRAIPLEHQPIFWFLKYHLRRPSEGRALHKEDFDGQIFTIHRTFSNGVLMDRTKTGEVHFIPMVSDFAPYMEIEKDKQLGHGIISPYVFVHPRGANEGKYYSQEVLRKLWNNACQAVGEHIPLYAGTKHSSCSQFVNEYGYGLDDVQTATDHARRESVKKYAKVEVSTRKNILEKNVMQFRKKLHDPGRKNDKTN